MAIKKRHCTPGTDKVVITLPSNLADWVRYTTKGRPGGLIDELIRRERKMKSNFYRPDTEKMYITLSSSSAEWLKKSTNGRPGTLVSGLVQMEMEKRKQDSTDF